MAHPAPLTGLVVCLEDVPVDNLVGPIEVLIQEGLRCFSLPAGHAGAAEVGAIFGTRSRIGAHGVSTVAQVGQCVADGATFVLADVADGDVVRAAVDSGVAVYAQAMTPTEVRAVLDLPVDGVMLYPADVVGHALGHRLATMGLAHRVVPRGGVGAYAAGEWFKAGAPAVCLDTNLLGDALADGDLGALRDRVPSFRQVVPQA